MDICIYAWPGLHVKSSKIHYCIGSLNVVVAPKVQHFSAFHLRGEGRGVSSPSKGSGCWGMKIEK